MRANRSLLLLLLAMMTLVAFPTPTASAHEDECLVAEHQGSLSIHWACTSNPETCTMNVRYAGTEANLACKEPRPVPCVAKLLAAGEQVKVCTNSLP